MSSPDSVAALAGQVLIAGFAGTELSRSTQEFLREAQPAGVILFARNLETPAQAHALVAGCRKLSRSPLFLAVDMEGGTVDRLKRVIAPAPSAAAVFSSGDPALYRRHGKLLAAECRALGFNLNFAPALDLALESARAILGSRAVSAQPAEVTSYAREFLRGMQAAGVLGCGKHFPGLGGASADTHFHLPAIQRSPAQIWKEDVEPYRRLRRQLPMIMVGHASYPACGDPRPASISPYWINKILRGKIGYRGLVVSDDLEMGAVAAAGSIEETSVAAISAGADLVLICHQEELLRRGWEAIMRAAEADARFRRRLRQSAGRVTKFKQRHPELRRFPPAPRPARIARLRAQLLEFAQLVEPQPLAASPA